jgi:chemosensory pili system protein ChpC
VSVPARQVTALEIRGVLIPTSSERLLLPNAALAEVIDFREPTPPGRDAPPWVLGSIVWRQRTLPVISAERLVGDQFNPKAPRLRIAVCHALLKQRQRPFIGIVSRGIPRLVRVTEDTIEETPEPPLDPDWPMLAQVHVNDVYALIPDMERIERLLDAEG